MLFDNEATQLWPDTYIPSLLNTQSLISISEVFLSYPNLLTHSFNRIELSTFTFRTTSLFSDSFGRKGKSVLGCGAFLQINMFLAAGKIIKTASRIKWLYFLSCHQLGENFNTTT
jgi:hypothetical protein